MNQKLPSVCIILYGLNQSNRLLQPWRYVTELARQLFRQGYSLAIITEVGPGTSALENIDGIPVVKIKSVRRFFWESNRELDAVIAAVDPTIVIWSVGLTSFFHQNFPPIAGTIQLGIFSSPIYYFKDLAHLGINKAVREYRLTGIHVLGALGPKWIARKFAGRSNLSWLVTQTETTRIKMVDCFWERPARAILPGVDAIWAPGKKRMADKRFQLGFEQTDFVIVFFGSPTPLRGLPLLIRAIADARNQRQTIRLLILNRRKNHDLQEETKYIHTLIQSCGIQDITKFIDGYLNPSDLVEMCSLSNLVALPFELIPSDAPLSILEARSLGKPILTTRIGCLPELAGRERTYYAQPGDLSSLVDAIVRAVDERTSSRASDRHPDASGFTRSWVDMGLEWSEFLQSL